MILREHYESLWRAIQGNNNKVSAKIQRRANVLNQILCRKNNISAYKAVLCNEGIIRTPRMRAPMESLSESEAAMLVAELKAMHYKEVLL